MIVVMAGGKIVVKLVEIKRKQNETRTKSDAKDKLESLAQNAARRISNSVIIITLFIIITL